MMKPIHKPSEMGVSRWPTSRRFFLPFSPSCRRVTQRLLLGNFNSSAEPRRPTKRKRWPCLQRHTNWASSKKCALFPRMDSHFWHLLQNVGQNGGKFFNRMRYFFTNYWDIEFNEIFMCLETWFNSLVAPTGPPFEFGHTDTAPWRSVNWPANTDPGGTSVPGVRAVAGRLCGRVSSAHIEWTKEQGQQNPTNEDLPNLHVENKDISKLGMNQVRFIWGVRVVLNLC